MKLLERFLADASEPPSEVPTWQWLEQNIELSPVMSDLPGKVSFEYFPASRFFFDHLDDPRLRKCTVLKCSQSGFTENAVMHLMRRIKERPVTTMWIGQNAEKTQEDAKKRFWPAIASCAAIQTISPAEDDRKRWTKKLIMFDTMNLLIRGSNSVGGLRGDPCSLIICDERSDWKAGRIHKARQRLSGKNTPVEISIGVGGHKNDELHTDWLEGSQTFVHFYCPMCHHSQPFRFGKVDSVLFDQPRMKGGLVWEENDTTKPAGNWDYEEVKKTVRFECEECGHLMHNSEKGELLKSAHEFHRNPQALPENFSPQVPALLLVWEKRSWGEIVVDFLKAVAAMKQGDIEPMMTFVQETLGEPWELRNARQKRGELLDRQGDYKLGECWMVDGEIEPNTTLILTFDRQQFNLVFIVRQWRKNGQSRMIWCGVFPGYEELRAFQLEKKIRGRCVWGDDGGRLTTEFRQTCLRYGWNVMKGEDFAHFTINDDKQQEKSYRQGYKKTMFDPGIGTMNQGRAMMDAWLHSSIWYKDKLYNVFIPGLGPLWELPSDTPSEYFKEVLANEWREKERADGSIEGYWHETGPDHFADCELEQVAVADIGGLTRVLPK